jgi:WD repeat-containing protein 23
MAKASGYLSGHHGGLTSLEARGDGRYILSNSKDQTAKLWDIRMMVPHATHTATYSDGGRSGRTWDYRGQRYP